MTTKVYNTILVAALLCLGFALMINAQEKPVTNVCLGCICEAISGCNLTSTCTTGVCGLFRITWPYWADGGKLTLNNDDPGSDQAYPNCVNDPYCAANTIQNYMTKYAQDCNGDNVIDCYDYAAIHKLGGFGCTADLTYQYQSKLNNCLKTQSANDIDVRMDG